MPEDRVVLSHWTVVLADPEDVTAVNGRIRGDSIATEERGGDLANQSADRESHHEAVRHRARA